MYGICLVPFLIFRVPYRLKLAYFCALSFSNTPLKYLIEGINQKSILKQSYFKRFGIVGTFWYSWHVFLVISFVGNPVYNI